MAGTTLLLNGARYREKRARTLVFCLLAFFVAASSSEVLGTKPAYAATFTVNSTGDAGDSDLGDGICDSNFTATATCTLRAAIQESNASTSVNDTIDFGIGNDGGVKTITPVPQLPIITDTVTINGYTQAGAAVNTATTNANNAVLKVELNGSSAGTVPLADGLILSGNGGAAGTVIKGLVINRFSGNGVRAEAGSNVTVEGNLIGTDPTGTLNRGNGFNGVLVFGSNNVIGGAADAAQNVISGNAGDGIAVVGTGATGNVVSNNHIGTDADAGADLGNTESGVFVTSPGTLVGGSSVNGAHNIISGNDGHGVLVDGSGAEGTKILGNLIGLDRNGFGFSNIGNTLDGVKVEDAPHVEVGGTLAGRGNTISDNGGHGVELVGSGEGRVLGNRIGTNASASSAAGNAGVGVRIENATDTAIGGRNTGARNVISGNASDGVLISGAEATNNRIEGNFIGTDGTGVKDLGNRLGVKISGAPGNLVGGTGLGTGNVISGNRSSGVGIEGTEATGNSVQGNLIGTNAAGTAALGNGDTGLFINSASGNTVGGMESGARNVISGNGGRGVGIDEPGATGNKVQGNFIGTDKDGTLDLGNVNEGVGVDGASDNLIGGTASGARNVISGNSSGVRIFGSSTADGANNRVEGNFIGTNASGTQDLGNSSDGVRILGAPNNTIGGTVAGAGNVISGNDGDGVVISCCADATGNRVLRNSIFANGGLGIDLVGGTENAAGATQNDPKDPDTGPNALQNKPAISSATTNGGALTVQGNLNSTPGKTFAIQFFSNPSGNEGKRFLGQRSVTTNANGNVSFTFTLSVSVAAGQRITATATRAGNTSEFSAPRTVAAQ